MENIILRTLVISLLIARTIYWRISEIKADAAKPKTQKRTSLIVVHILIRNALNVLVVMQLLGLNILSFKHEMSTELLGTIICVLAVLCSFLGRKALGLNWTDSAESQIKMKHSLVTNGIYKFIRHPIAVGYSFFIIGVELLVGSWLVIPFAIGLLVGGYVQSRKEEAILTREFGGSHVSYMTRTKMFIPYIF